MKNLQKALMIILVIFVFSCNKEENLVHLERPHQLLISGNPSIVKSQAGGAYNIPVYAQNELIVRYDPGLDDSTKMFLRQLHDVLNYEVCQLCLDESIEKWFFDIVIQIEPKKQAIEAYGGGVADVDYEFDFTSELGDIEVGTSEDFSYESLIVPTNSGVTIAVLDTGFDPFFPFWYDEEDIPVPMLYNASEMAAGEELSGWDYVDYDHNPFDNNPGKHGTAISYIFQNILSNAGVPFQIMPLKICNAAGETSYFKFLCASKYAFERADVVQMSLGWYDDGFGDFENTIYNYLLGVHSDVVVVASAGNEASDNDEVVHYPSSYDTENMIAVAAMNATETDTAYFSNYGAESVDFFAVGEEVPFYDYGYNPIEPGLAGTSFAAPQVAAIAAKFLYYDDSLSPSDLIDDLIENGLAVPASCVGKVKHDKYFSLMVE
ncbi:MAG: S8 family serine peptidase [Chitinophagales bacterium]|nr:S8 family serine peptidase [Chitinophagales bacterium]